MMACPVSSISAIPELTPKNKPQFMHFWKANYISSSSDIQPHPYQASSLVLASATAL